MQVLLLLDLPTAGVNTITNSMFPPLICPLQYKTNQFEFTWEMNDTLFASPCSAFHLASAGESRRRTASHYNDSIAIDRGQPSFYKHLISMLVNVLWFVTFRAMGQALCVPVKGLLHPPSILVAQWLMPCPHLLLFYCLSLSHSVLSSLKS